MKTLQLLLVTLLASPSAATGVVVTLDATRCSTGAYGYYLTGSGMVGAHSALLLDGWTVQETSAITPAILQGANIFVSGQLPAATALQAAEVSALQAWIAAGGGALLMGEGMNFMQANAQYAGMVNGPQFGGEIGQTNVVDVLVATSHPLLQGAAGTVTSLSGFNFPGYWVNPSPTSPVIATNPDGSAAVVAVTYGAGRALLLNDVNYFAYPPTYSTSHEVFWRNAIAWLAGDATPVTSFCSGDGSAGACPCGNSGAAGAGCASSVGPGSVLAGTGTASVSNDGFVLGGTGMSNSSALYFQGT